jgi:uncharacterized protein YdeI (YjbR/CyaY-like superfamily)
MALKKGNVERFDGESRQVWRRWLRKNGLVSSGVWLVLCKKNSGETRITYAEAVEEALCYGWIDSTVNKLDEKRYLQYFAPRKPKSIWSKSNKKRVVKLIREGRMTARGLAKINAAKREGTWASFDAIERLSIPMDLRKALRADAAARKKFAAFSSSSKKMILFWILSARRPDTRTKRIETTIFLASRNIKANHYLRQRVAVRQRTGHH